jgi:hypothetical protein
MAKKIYIRKKELTFGLEYNKMSLTEIKSVINEFADRYDLKITFVFAVNAAISQYTAALVQLCDNYNSVPPVHDDDLFNQLIQPLPKIGKQGLVMLRIRLDETIADKLAAAISNFTSVSGQRLTKTSAVRTAIDIYINKLRLYISRHQKGRAFNEEKIIREIAP